jgi:hypothetical protein
VGDAGDNLVPSPAEGPADEAVEGGGVSGHEQFQGSMGPR